VFPIAPAHNNYTPHKVGKEKGKESNGKLPNLKIYGHIGGRPWRCFRRETMAEILRGIRLIASLTPFFGNSWHVLDTCPSCTTTPLLALAIIQGR
jgi:hypothetical protein